MLISFRAKRVNKKNISSWRQSWGLGRRVGPSRGQCTSATCQNGLVFATKKIKR